MLQQAIVFTVIGLSLVLFVDGRLRYDFVALMALLILTLTHIIAPSEAFLGFGHPAVVTVAAILVVSSALLKTGALNLLVDRLNRSGTSISVKIASLMLMTAVMSSFMNNVGALALVMPIAIKIGHQHKIPVSYLLMPVAFSSLLGGLITEIGTPPNLIISGYRQNLGLGAFEFFDFAPVGIGLTIVGILFISTLGWRMIPKRKGNSDKNGLFEVEAYLSEILVPENNKALSGKAIKDIYQHFHVEMNILSIIRQHKKIIAPLANEIIMAGDVLVVKADHNELKTLVEKAHITLKGSKVITDEDGNETNVNALELLEIVLRDDSPLIGRTAIEIGLRNQYNVNLVGVSRKGTSSLHRLKVFRFKAGDILLIQTPASSVQETIDRLRCLPLASRSIDLFNQVTRAKRRIAVLTFALSIALTSLGIVPVQIAFSINAVAMVMFRILTPKEFYEAIEWPIILMLGALLPVGDALQTTGGADSIANLMLLAKNILSPEWMLVLLMFTTMLLTNIINNAAATVLMAPIAVSLATQLGISIDPMLMAVCVASSCAFMTPIGHQSNTLVMGPGGYRFRDYWKMGLPVSLIVLALGAPLIMFFWPL